MKKCPFTLRNSRRSKNAHSRCPSVYAPQFPLRPELRHSRLFPTACLNFGFFVIFISELMSMFSVCQAGLFCVRPACPHDPFLFVLVHLFWHMHGRRVTTLLSNYFGTPLVGICTAVNLQQCFQDLLAHLCLAHARSSSNAE